MNTKVIHEMAQICEADPVRMERDIKKYGIQGFFASLDLLGYPAGTEVKLNEIYRILRLVESEDKK